LNDIEILRIQNKLLVKEEFLMLNRLLNQFNVFTATDMERREIKHTKFLAYLLDPNESHGLKDIFLQNFVSRISLKFENFPSALDLDFPFATVKSEYNLGNGKVDLLIDVPFRGKKEKIYIAIENKIDSTQGDNQLKKYSEKLDKNYGADNVYKLFLTLNEEELLDDSWISISYGNIISPSIRATIDSVNHVRSTHLVHTLEDYLKLIGEADINELDNLARNLIDDNQIKNYIEILRKNINNLLFSEILIKHRKAIKYLLEINTDKRSEVLKWWLEECPHEFALQVVDDDGRIYELNFFRESSSLKYLRFSILTKENRTSLKKLAQNPVKKWLNSGCPLAFEIIFNSFHNNECANFKVNLELGPLDNQEIRVELLRNIYADLQQTRQYSETIPNLYWNALISHRAGEYEDLAVKNCPNPQKWIQDNVFSLDKNNQMPAEIIKKLIIILNKKLHAYFDNS
jgi:hypothetical protein